MHSAIRMAKFHVVAGCIAVFSITFGVSKFLWNNQDADFGVLFYERFGVDPESSLRGKVVWITGASSGIGEQLAYDFIKYGCKIVISARRVEKLKQVKKNCIAQARMRDLSFDDNDIFVLPLDYTRFESHSNATSQVIQRFGQIDILIHNAGIFEPLYVMQTPLDVHKLFVDTLYLGRVSLTREVLPYMIEKKKGQIANSLSVFNRFAFPVCTLYVGPTSAVKAYVDTLRLEMLHHGIKFTNFMIGVVDTPFLVDPETNEDKHFRELYPDQPDPMNMITVERFSAQAVTSLVNEIEEAWMARHPMLKMTYMSQYTPRIFQWFSKTYMMEYFFHLAKTLGIPPPP